MNLINYCLNNLNVFSMDRVSENYLMYLELVVVIMKNYVL